MFTRHPNLQLPKNSRQSLWRYFSEERLLDLLSTGELFFTNISHFEDEFEGKLTRRTRERLARWHRHQEGTDTLASEHSVTRYEDFHLEFFASCWHMNNYESFLMWKAYADRGYAVHTTFERLQAAADAANESISGGVIQYVDHERDETDAGNVFQTIMNKPIQFTDEREFRLLLWDADPKNTQLTRTPVGVRVAVRPEMLIESIIVHPLKKSVPDQMHELAVRHEITLRGSALNLRSRE